MITRNYIWIALTSGRSIAIEAVLQRSLMKLHDNIAMIMHCELGEMRNT